MASELTNVARAAPPLLFPANGASQSQTLTAWLMNQDAGTGAGEQDELGFGEVAALSAIKLLAHRPGAELCAKPLVERFLCGRGR